MDHALYLTTLQKEIETRLSEIERELSQPTPVDPTSAKDATGAVLRRAKLQQEQEALRLRLDALKHARAEQEREEAEARLHEIQTALADLTADASQARAQFQGHWHMLLTLIRDADARRRQSLDLREEARYLAAKYDLPATPLPALSLPTREDVEALMRAVGELDAPYTSPWGIKLDLLREERRAEAEAHPKPTLSATSHQESPEKMIERLDSERAKQTPRPPRRGGVTVRGLPTGQGW